MFDKCEICGRYADLERHHVFGGCRRQTSEKYGAVVFICPECHRNITDEKGPDIHAEWQEKLMRENGWSIGDFIQIFGRNYL